MESKAGGYIEMMKLWQETARHITQLATAALVLPLLFLRDVLGVEKGPLLPVMNGWIYCAWVLFLFSLTAGLLYQIVVTRLLGDAYVGTQARPLYPERLFRTMAAALALGVVCMIGALVTAR